MVFASNGRMVGESRAAIETVYPAEGHVEHDAEAIVESVAECFRQLAVQMNAASLGKISAAALCTQRSSVICWSRRTGMSLSPVLSWQDVRAAKLLDGIALSAEAIHGITGLRLSPHYGASKLRWLLENVPAVREMPADDLCIGPLASFLVFRLTREKTFAVDPCNASRTLLWDIHARDWSPELLRVFHVERSLLPVSRPNLSRWGDLQLAGMDIPLTVVTGDQSAVPFAFEQRNGRAMMYLTLGTGAFLQWPESGRTTCPGLLNSVLLEEAGGRLQFALEATINGAGSALDWLARQLAIEESELLSRLPGWLDSGIEPPLFINSVGGLAAPFWQPDRMPQFIGEGDAAAKAVAVVESIAFLVATNFRHMQSCGVQPAAIVATGGLARLEGLLARVAVLCDCPVMLAADIEATARGAARLANPALPAISAIMQQPGWDSGRIRLLQDRYKHWITEISI